MLPGQDPLCVLFHPCCSLLALDTQIWVPKKSTGYSTAKTYYKIPNLALHLWRLELIKKVLLMHIYKVFPAGKCIILAAQRLGKKTSKKRVRQQTGW